MRLHSDRRLAHAGVDQDVASRLISRAEQAFVTDPITPLNAALEGRYRTEPELGENGVATVYLADLPG